MLLRRIPLVAGALSACARRGAEEAGHGGQRCRSSRRRTGAPAEIVWAPDGRRFAYEQDGTVCLYDVPAKTRRTLVALATLQRRCHARSRLAGLRVAESRREGADHPVVSRMATGLLSAPGATCSSFRLAAGDWTQLTATPSRRARSQALARRPPGFLPPRQRPLLAGDRLAQSACGSRATAPARCWNGRLDWVYPEELDLARRTGGRRTPSSVAYLQFDVSREPLYPHADLLPTAAGVRAAALPQSRRAECRRPPGRGVGPGGPTRWMDLGDTRDSLLARVALDPGQPRPLRPASEPHPEPARLAAGGRRHGRGPRWCSGKRTLLGQRRRLSCAF